MILVVGGAYSGKKDFVKRELGYNSGQFSHELQSKLPVFYDLHKLEITLLRDIDSLAEQLLKKEVVSCNLIGSGIISVNPLERARVEAVGRLCIVLAEKAERVARVTAGIGVWIK